MNIHEHQAKEILKDFGAPVSKGVVIYSISELKNKYTKVNKILNIISFGIFLIFINVVKKEKIMRFNIIEFGKIRKIVLLP